MGATLGLGNVRGGACEQSYDRLMDTLMRLQKTTHWDTNKGVRQLGDNVMILADELIKLDCNILSKLFTSLIVNKQQTSGARLPADKF